MGLAYQGGHVIGDRYRLESKLGEGGMGEVWRAQHVTLCSPVAIKFINPALAASEQALHRFMLEAQSSAALRSTHIVQVFDFGVDNAVPYIAMELLNGESLGDRLARVRTLSPADVARIMSETSRAMTYAHDAGIVHRDLKPDNIFLSREGPNELAKVLDFGIAKVTGGGFDVTTGGGTRTGAIMGTPYYLSPEQARGNRSLDHRSDLWALGVITYECLVGAKPFTSDGLGDLLMMICSEPHPIPSTQAPVPDGFDGWIARALAKDPKHRFESAAQMFDAFDALLSPTRFVGANTPQEGTAGTGAVVTNSLLGTTGGIEAAVATKQRSFRSAALATVAFGALAVAGISAWWVVHESSASAPDPTASAEPAAAPAPELEPSVQPAEDVDPAGTEPSSTLEPTAIDSSAPEASSAAPPTGDRAQTRGHPGPVAVKLPRKPPPKTGATPSAGSRPTLQPGVTPAGRTGTGDGLFEDRK